MFTCLVHAPTWLFGIPFRYNLLQGSYTLPHNYSAYHYVIICYIIRSRGIFRHTICYNLILVVTRFGISFGTRNQLQLVTCSLQDSPWSLDTIPLQVGNLTTAPRYRIGTRHWHNSLQNHQKSEYRVPRILGSGLRVHTRPSTNKLALDYLENPWTIHQ